MMESSALLHIQPGRLDPPSAEVIMLGQERSVASASPRPGGPKQVGPSQDGSQVRRGDTNTLEKGRICRLGSPFNAPDT